MKLTIATKAVSKRLRMRGVTRGSVFMQAKWPSRTAKSEVASELEMVRIRAALG